MTFVTCCVNYILLNIRLYQENIIQTVPIIEITLFKHNTTQAFIINNNNITRTNCIQYETTQEHIHFYSSKLSESNIENNNIFKHRMHNCKSCIILKT